MQADATLPVQDRRGYKNAADALWKMARHEGLRGFFTGANPTIVRALAVNVGMLSTYEPSKERLKPYLGTGVWNVFAASFISGFCASAMSLPFDFIKTRLQKQSRRPDGTLPYNGVLDCARKVAAKEGIGTFYNGFATYVIRISPHIMITWMAMEALKTVDFLK